MVTKSRIRRVKSGLRNCDDIVFLLTGKRVRHVAGRTLNIFGGELEEKARKWIQLLFAGPDDPDLPPDSPYSILGIHTDALDVVVRGAYRALAKEYHPDTGTKPDPEKFQQATEAYKAIIKEREAEAEPKKEK